MKQYYKKKHTAQKQKWNLENEQFQFDTPRFLGPITNTECNFENPTRET